MARQVASRRRKAATARFELGEHSRVFTDDGREVQPGSGEVGRVALGFPIPLGYYKDPAEDRRRVPDDRRSSVVDPRRPRHGRGRRHDHPARSRLGVHQHRRREGVPRGGRGGVEGAPRRRRRQRRRACPTRSGARPSSPSCRSSPAPTVDADDLVAHTAHAARRVQGAEAHRVRRARAAGPNGKPDYRWARVDRRGLTERVASAREDGRVAVVEDNHARGRDHRRTCTGGRRRSGASAACPSRSNTCWSTTATRSSPVGM